VKKGRIFSKGFTNISAWLSNIVKQEKEDRDRKILEIHLRAWNTQQDIGDALGVDQKTASRVIEDFRQKVPGNQTPKDFIPYIYNIWNTQKGNDTSHFGSFPAVFMRNLFFSKR